MEHLYRDNHVFCHHLTQTGLGRTSWETLLSKKFDKSKSLYFKELYGHFGCVNAVEFSRNDEWLASGGDDRRVLLWKLGLAIQNSTGSKLILKTCHFSNIFCLQFEHDTKRILSAGNDDRIIRHNIERNEVETIYSNDEPVYGMSLPVDDDNIFATASENGSVQVWDLRSQENILCVAISSGNYHSCCFNPMDSRLIAAANADTGTELYDIRCPYRPLLRYGGQTCKQSAMSVCFNGDGTRLLSLIRKAGPVVYNTQTTHPMCTFTDESYKNACTMKSACFAGNADQFVVSGSDDAGVYIWKLPDQNSKVSSQQRGQMVLRQHLSIVNQVRYSKHRKVLVTAGVEKHIKLWSQMRMPGCHGDPLIPMNSSRQTFAANDYIEMFLRDDLPLNHNYDDGDMTEDPRMIAFFDSLIHRVHLGPFSDDSSDSGASTDDDLTQENVLDLRRLFRR